MSSRMRPGGGVKLAPTASGLRRSPHRGRIFAERARLPRFVSRLAALSVGARTAGESSPGGLGSHDSIHDCEPVGRSPHSGRCQSSRLPQSLRSFAMTTPITRSLKIHHHNTKRRHREEAAGRRGDLGSIATIESKIATVASLLRNDNFFVWSPGGRSQFQLRCRGLFSVSEIVSDTG
jgi:hypothetical protein